MLNTVWQREHKWLGHVLCHEVLLRDIIEVRMKGKATRGRLDMLSDFKSSRRQLYMWRSSELQKIWVCGECKEMKEAKDQKKKKHFCSNVI